VSVPSVTVPSVTVPAVTVPQVTVPSVTTPVVTTPPVKTPPVKTPPVKTPPVKTPPVKTPPVKTLPVKPPTVSTPTVTNPAGNAPPGPVKKAADAVKKVAGVKTPEAKGAKGATSSGASASSTSAGSGSGGSGAAGSTPSVTANGTPIVTLVPTTTPKVAGPATTRKRDRALRDTVMRFAGCLDSVPSSERRVLSLRAGVGAEATRTRTQVAHITGLTNHRVAVLERRGLKKLRGLGRSGRCASAASSESTGALAGTTAPALPGGGSTSALGERDTPQRHSAASATKPPTARDVAVDHPLVNLGSAPVDLAPIILAIGLAALLVVVLRETRRQRR
jgi:hypothetical protein